MAGITAKLRAKKARARQMQYKRVCASVDKRDGNIDRVTGQVITGVRHHHHLKARSLGGQHRTENLIVVSMETHLAIHAKKVFVSGNADAELTVEWRSRVAYP